MYEKSKLREVFKGYLMIAEDMLRRHFTLELNP